MKCDYCVTMWYRHSQDGSMNYCSQKYTHTHSCDICHCDLLITANRFTSVCLCDRAGMCEHKMGHIFM